MQYNIKITAEGLNIIGEALNVAPLAYGRVAPLVADLLRQAKEQEFTAAQEEAARIVAEQAQNTISEAAPRAKRRARRA